MAKSESTATVFISPSISSGGKRGKQSKEKRKAIEMYRDARVYEDSRRCRFSLAAQARCMYVCMYVDRYTV